MLALSPLRDFKDERAREMKGFFLEDDGDFSEFSGGNLFVDSIDFEDIFDGINDGDLLPDLEMEYSSEINLAEFSVYGGEEKVEDCINIDSRKEDVDKALDFCAVKSSSNTQGEDDVVSKPNNECVAKIGNLSIRECDKGKKSSSSSYSNQSKNNPQGKRRIKVDWTPELHRRFVQAVEQLGVDKAVPSRILELMGIDYLTRHNIASHLQKYRSQRKHLLAREAEAASWNQRRQVYGGATTTTATATAANGGGGKKYMNNNPWLVPTIGFPPMAPPPPLSHFRPNLHVWGHPSPPPPPLPPPSWTPHPPPDPSFWHAHHQCAPNSLTPGTPCFATPVTPARFPTPVPVPGIPPSNMYKGAPPAPIGQTLPKPPVDFQPSRESVDAAIGDVLSKPWLPLPLRLKPPSLDSVLVELNRQGICKIP